MNYIDSETMKKLVGASFMTAFLIAGCSGGNEEANGKVVVGLAEPTEISIATDESLAVGSLEGFVRRSNLVGLTTSPTAGTSSSSSADVSMVPAGPIKTTSTQTSISTTRSPTITTRPTTTVAPTTTTTEPATTQPPTTRLKPPEIARLSAVYRRAFTDQAERTVSFATSVTCNRGETVKIQIQLIPHRDGVLRTTSTAKTCADGASWNGSFTNVPDVANYSVTALVETAVGSAQSTVSASKINLR